MIADSTLDKTCWRLREEQGPWTHRALFRIGLALHAAGQATSEEAADELAWQLTCIAGDHVSMREALASVGVDVPAVEAALRLIEEEHATQAREDEREMFRKALR